MQTANGSGSSVKTKAHRIWRGKGGEGERGEGEDIGKDQGPGKRQIAKGTGT